MKKYNYIYFLKYLCMDCILLSFRDSGFYIFEFFLNKEVRDLC